VIRKSQIVAGVEGKGRDRSTNRLDARQRVGVNRELQRDWRITKNAARVALLLVALSYGVCARAEILRWAAIGDTGVNCTLVDLDEPREAWEQKARASQQTLVAEYLAEVVREQRIRDIVFLGDNFYPDGLEPGPLGDACAELAFALPYGKLLPPEHLHLVPGNHDHGTEGSVQRETDLSGKLWTFHARPDLVHLAPGLLDLVLFDSEVWLQGEEAREPLVRELTECISRSSAPWLILAAHHPLRTIGRHSAWGLVGWLRKEDFASLAYRRYREAVRQAILGAGRPVQLFLAGHDHSLQFLHEPEQSPLLPADHIVSGSGSKLSGVQRIDQTHWGAAIPGFVVLEIDTAKPQVLVVRFFDSSRRKQVRQFQIERKP
jgi:calcineurin-like phosphoesterase family protein